MQAVAATRHGAVWFGMITGHILRYAEGTFTRFGTGEGLMVEKPVRVLAEAPLGKGFALWAGTADGLYRLDGAGWEWIELGAGFRAQWALLEWERLSPGVDLMPARVRSLRYLLESQRADGGWGQTDAAPSDALSTAYALAALGVLRQSLAVGAAKLEAGRGYLLSQQAPDTGEFSSIPDIAGPRPFVFDTPLLATIFPLLALALVRGRDAGRTGGTGACGRGGATSSSATKHRAPFTHHSHG